MCMPIFFTVIERGIKMKLKDLLPLLYKEGTSSEHSRVRIQIYTTGRCVYEGEISVLYNRILTDATTLDYKTLRLGKSMGDFDVLEMIRYSNENTESFPKYNWPINIIIY